MMKRGAQRKHNSVLEPPDFAWLGPALPQDEIRRIGPLLHRADADGIAA